MKKPLIERLEARKFEAPSGCWEWTGSTDTIGYGLISLTGKLYGVHRVSFFVHNGFWPNVCRHSCDNKKCFNPDHLVDGDRIDNVQDAMDRGRIRTKYSSTDIERMVRLRHSGLTYREISNEMGMSQAQISRILNHKQRTGHARKDW